MIKTSRLCILLLCAVFGNRVYGQNIIDNLSFGNQNSEKTHQFVDNKSATITGGLKEPARVLLPDGNSWKGGSMSFIMKVDPDKQNYLTARFWGDDLNDEHLLLLCEGKLVGYRHLGDIEALDIGTELSPFLNGRFLYKTTPLPLSITKGKTEVNLTIESNGRLWAYASTFDKYQYAMDGPTRGIYRVYTHTDEAFVPPANEKQGTIPAQPPVRKSPGDEVMGRLKDRVNKLINGLLNTQKPLTQVQMQLLAKAYTVKWTYAYHSSKVIGLIKNGLDNVFFTYSKDSKFAQADPATYNPEWFGIGPSGQVIHLLYDELKPDLDKTIANVSTNNISRRAAYSDMLVVCREWHRQHRRQYSNQTMINDLYGIYYPNKAVEDLDPAKAIAENDIRRYLYESIGLQPWLGSETANGPSRSAGDNYMQLTPQGLTKELGFVGYYGEVLDWATEIYKATQPAPDKPGDEKIKAQLEKIARARSWFRYPAVDADGNRAMRIETEVGWRDTHYPGAVTYAQRASWDGSPLQVAAATLNPQLVGYVQQMFTDNQFFSTIDLVMQDKNFRTTAGLLSVPDEYELLKAQQPTNQLMPMGWGQPDVVFADTEDGVIAIKNGNEMFYASLYWRARNAINFLAKVHTVNPNYDRIAVVHEDEEFDPSGLFYTRPDHTNFGFANGGIKYPEDLHSAHAGEKLPIAKIPNGVAYKPGDESMFAGRASFYHLQYGHYLIGMNATNDKTFDLPIPTSFKNATDLVTKNKVNGKSLIKIKPQTTVVLYVP